MSKRVLVVDDSPIIRQSIRSLLESEDFDVAEASDGEEGIAAALQIFPDLIILDFAMPVMNGADAAKVLKVLLPDTPIILFSQHSRETLKPWSANVDAVVSKADVTLLLEMARSLISGKRWEAATG